MTQPEPTPFSQLPSYFSAHYSTGDLSHSAKDHFTHHLNEATPIEDHLINLVGLTKKSNNGGQKSNTCRVPDGTIS